MSMAETMPEDFRGLVTGKRTKLYTSTDEITGVDAINPRGGIPDISSSGAEDRELITITDIDYESGFPETRTNIGESHFFTHGSPDITCPFMAEGDTETEKFFFDRHSVNPDSRELRVYPWLFRTTNQEGKHTEFIFRGKLTHLRVHKARGEQGEFVTVYGVIRVIDMVPLVKRDEALYLKSVSRAARVITLTFSRGLNTTDAAAAANYSHPGIELADGTSPVYAAGTSADADSTVTLTASEDIEAGTYAITARAALRDVDDRRLGRNQTRTFTVA